MAEPIGKYTIKTCRSCGLLHKIPSYPWLREVRRQSKLTLREAARQIGFTASYLCDLELGRRTPTKRVIEFYEKLAGKL